MIMLLRSTGQVQTCVFSSQTVLYAFCARTEKYWSNMEKIRKGASLSFT